MISIRLHNSGSDPEDLELVKHTYLNTVLATNLHCKPKVRNQVDEGRAHLPQ